MKGVYKGFAFILFLAVLFSLSARSASAAAGDDLIFNGTVQDVNGSRLNNTLINITIWEMSGTGPQLIGSNSTYSNESGLFSLNVSGNVSWLYKVVVTYTNQTGIVDYVGPSTPQFPYNAFITPPLETNIDFYLRPAGTINITVINSTGDRASFWYQVKDIKLGYTIASNFGSNNYVQEKIIYVPRDRNYSIMVNMNQSTPVSFEWNNFSSTSDYNITDANGVNLSFYNATNHTLHKQFNCTDSPIQIYGYIINGSGVGVDGNWDNFTVVTYLLEPGNMVYLGAKFPYNMSLGPGSPSNDFYNLTSGFYNITLPSSTETTNALLFAAARNGTDYYGGFRNISLNSSQEINFTMYGLLGNPVNITVQDANNSLADKNVSTKKQAFNLVNATTNATLENVNAHIEIKVDYSNSSLYNCTEFTFMTSLSGENGTFYIPLINETGIKEINVYSMDYAPRRVGTKTAAEIQANNNITMFAFIKEGGIDPDDIIPKAYLKAFVYMSNSTCSIPYPQGLSGDPCLIVGDVTMDMFSPLPAIIGGGKVDFSVKMLSTGIEVKYINVDFLASGPPDAKFDSNQTESASTDTFGAALRFGSMGPTIYDYVLIGMPYTEGSTSQTGLDEDSEVNMSIPLFYDENWNVIWNTSTNGTNGTNLAGNYSHYYEHRDEWETLMNGTTCTRTAITDASQINATHPCYFDASENLIWIRIPHFDGNEPTIISDVITATPDDDDDVTPGGSSGPPAERMPSVSQSWDKLEPGAAVSMLINKSGLEFSQIQIQVRNRANYVSITITKLAGQPATVVHNVTGRAYQYVEIDRSDNINDTNIQIATIKFKVNKSWISDNNIDKNKVYLNRYANNQWNKLTTTLASEDINHVYYSAATPGFSVFVITGEIAVAQVCTPDTKQCLGDDLQQCKADGSAWETTEICQYGCNSTSLACKSAPEAICTPGINRCTGDNLEQCSSDGLQWTVSETCTYGCNSTALACKSAPAIEDQTLVYLAIIVIIIVAIIGFVGVRKLQA